MQMGRLTHVGETRLSGVEGKKGLHPVSNGHLRSAPRMSINAAAQGLLFAEQEPGFYDASLCCLINMILIRKCGTF